MLTSYGIRYPELAQANRDSLLSDFFVDKAVITCPTFLPFIAQRSLNGLYAKRPTGWNVPTSGSLLFGVTGNADLPLVPGVVMSLPQTKTISTGTGKTTPSLASLALANSITPI